MLAVNWRMDWLDRVERKVDFICIAKKEKPTALGYGLQIGD